MKINDKINDIYCIHSHYKGGGDWPPSQKRCRDLTSFMVSVALALTGVNGVNVVAVAQFSDFTSSVFASTCNFYMTCNVMYVCGYKRF